MTTVQLIMLLVWLVSVVLAGANFAMGMKTESRLVALKCLTAVVGYGILMLTAILLFGLAAVLDVAAGIAVGVTG